MAKAEARVKSLTKRVVDAARPEARRYVLWDEKLKGFGLRIEPRAPAEGPPLKTFIARYRAGGGRTGTLRQKTLGRYGTVTVDEARTAARKLLGAASAGADPLGDAKAQRQAGITVAEVCDWYFAEVDAGRLLGRRGNRIKPSTIVSDKSRVEAHVKPLIGSRAMRSLSLPDLEEMQANIAAGKTARKVRGKRPRGGVARGGGGAGGRTLAMLRAIFEHALRRQLIAANPAKGARLAVGRRRAARLSIDDFHSLGEAMRTSKEGPTALAAVRLLAMTGLRRNEALGMRPEWLMEAGAINFPDTKAGPQIRPIGRAAVKLIKQQIAINDSEWVFPAERGEGHFIGLPKVLKRLCATAKLKNITIHTLRHSYASIAAELGFSELVIAGLLGHSAGSVTSGYVHLDTALVAAADRVSATIAAALGGNATSAVVPLKKKAIQ
jgi:integrase